MRRGELRITLVAAVAAVVVACLVHPVRAETSGLDPRLEKAIALYREDGAASALADFERLAREFAKGDRKRDYAAALHYVGESHWRLGDYKRAQEHLDRALAVERAAGDRDGEGKTLNVLGLLAWDEGEYDRDRAFPRRGRDRPRARRPAPRGRQPEQPGARPGRAR
jgi:tetratricopeptide (TPR) repeat protein